VLCGVHFISVSAPGDNEHSLTLLPRFKEHSHRRGPSRGAMHVQLATQLQVEHLFGALVENESLNYKCRGCQPGLTGGHCSTECGTEVQQADNGSM